MSKNRNRRRNKKRLEYITSNVEQIRRMVRNALDYFPLPLPKQITMTTQKRTYAGTKYGEKLFTIEILNDAGSNFSIKIDRVPKMQMNDYSYKISHYNEYMATEEIRELLRMLLLELSKIKASIVNGSVIHN